MSGIRTTVLATAVRNYCAKVGKGYSTEDTAHFFEVAPVMETKLRKAILGSSDILSKINMFDVQQISGRAVTLGSDKLATGRKSGGRFSGRGIDLDEDKYELKVTDSVIDVGWELLAAWINSGTQGEFNNKLNSHTNEQFASDIVRVGWNGTHAAKNTDPDAFPNGEDINEGWHARVMRLAPDQIVTAGENGITIYFDPDGEKDANGKLKAHYKTLDAMASDLINNHMPERFHNASDLVVLVGRDLVSAAQYKLFTEADKPSEHNEAQLLSKSIAGRPAYVPAYFPGNRMVITSFKNLSVYTQKGSRRRKIKDNDDKACLESFYWRMEGYMVEDLEKYAAFDEHAVVVGTPDDAPAKPEITTAPLNASVVQGQTANFTVTASNATEYDWLVDGMPIGDSDAACAIDTTEIDHGTYEVKVIASGDGGSDEAHATLTVNVA